VSRSATAKRESGALLRPQALLGEGCIEWFRPTEREPRIPITLLVSGSMIAIGALLAMTACIKHGRTVALAAHIGEPACTGGETPCLARMEPVPRDARIATALSVGDRGQASFADGVQHTLTVVSVHEGASPSFDVAWNGQTTGRSGPVRLESAQHRTVLAWIAGSAP
jgi:hypothetical protein